MSKKYINMKHMGIRTSKPANKRNMAVTTSCNSPNLNKSLLIEMDNNSTNSQSSDNSNSPDRETLLLMLKEKKFDEFEQLVKKRNNYDDITHFYPDPDNGTLLDIACRSVGNCRIVRFLLYKLVDPNLVNKITGKTPAHEVIERGDAAMLDELTKHVNFKSANVVDRAGYTPLHIAVEKNQTRFIRVLLDNCRRCGSPININISTREHPSPLHLALKKSKKQAACVLLQYSDIDLDFQKDSNGRTCREIVLQEFPDLAKEFSTEPLSHPGPILHSLLTQGLTESFIKLASEVESQYYLKYDCNGWSYLQLACDYGYADVVEFLLNIGVNPNEIYKEKIPIMIAARNGHYGILKRLFHQPKIELQVEGHGSVLHSIIRGMLDSDQVSKRGNHLKCLEFLLNEIFPVNQSESNNDKPKLNIDFVDSSGSSALHLAVLLSDEQVQKSLIYAGAHLYQKNPSGEVPLDLIKAEVLSDYLDDCITAGDHSKMETDRKIYFEYKQFVNPSKNSTCRGYEMEFFTTIERVPEFKKFLKHPVAESFINIKWNFFKKYYYANLMFYFLFCVFLSTYIFLKQEYDILPYDLSDPSCCKLRLVCTILTLLLYSVLVSREICQFFISPRTYLTSLENWFEIILISIVGAVFIHPAINESLPPIYGACAILVSWMELMFLIGKHGRFATNIEMFKTVAWNFSKIFGLYSIMILSFALSFYLLFYDGNAAFMKNDTNKKIETNKNDAIKFWRSVPLSIFKTIIMLTGEFSTDSTIPLSSNFSIEHVFFTLFVICISIILYNLLNGLAVGDTQAIRENAEIVALASQVKLIAQFEHFVATKPFQFFRDFLSKCCPCTKGLLGIQFYRGICSETYVSVTLHQNNMIHVKGNYGDKLSKALMKMRSCVVRRAQRVLENRTEVKLLQNVKTLLVDSESRIFERMETFIENTIAQQMEMLREFVITEFQKQTNKE